MNFAIFQTGCLDNTYAQLLVIILWIPIGYFLPFSYQEYKVGDVNYMRVQFYVSGSKGKATVHVEAKKVITCFSYFDII